MTSQSQQRHFREIPKIPEIQWDNYGPYVQFKLD